MEIFFKDEIIDLFTHIFKGMNISIYLVGGAVRDKILGLEPIDYDFVAEIDPQKHFETSIQLSRWLACDINYNEYYNTCKFTIYNKEIDFVMARKEFYPYPASKPQITASNIFDDLARRDFTINSIAYDLKKRIIVDPFNGIDDIKSGIIRVLHTLSFRDDPTRIFRAIKYASRFGFDFDEITYNILIDSLKAEYLKLLSPSRMRNDILDIFNENDIIYAIKLFDNLGFFDKLTDMKINLNDDLNKEYFKTLKEEEKFCAIFYRNENAALHKIKNLLNLSARFLNICKTLNEISFNLSNGNLFEMYRLLILSEGIISSNLLLTLFKDKYVLNYLNYRDKIRLNREEILKVDKNLRKEYILDFKIKKLIELGGDKNV